MTALMPATMIDDEIVRSAIAAAADSIAPSWPLDQMIAVNPYWGRVNHAFDDVAEALESVAGSPMAMPLDYYRDAWRRGEVAREDLAAALTESGSGLTVEALVAALDQTATSITPMPLLTDLLDRRRDLQREPSWCDNITHQVSQFCAAYFDRDQANWHPDQSGRLYTSWRDALRTDHSIPLMMRTPGIPARAGTLLDNPEQQIAASLAQSGMPVGEWATYLQTVLMRVSGWAAWCAYLRWQSRLQGEEDHSLVDLLAMRLSWETLLDDGDRGEGSPWSAWQLAWQQRRQQGASELHQAARYWQRAQEIAYQRQLRERLLAGPAVEVAGQPAVQAAFCIDVRSEVIRRHLEQQSPDIQTLGFAGFFGLPISYAPLGTSARRPQLPGLLAPALNITDSTGDKALDEKISAHRRSRLRGMVGWKVFESVPLSTFTLVEALGMGYLGKLVKRTLPGGVPFTSEDGLGLDKTARRAIRPTLDAGTAGGVAGQAAIAAQVLAGMGLGRRFARLVLLIGHGSQNRNNPHRAGLDCGACCGQTGEVNARTLAGLLNSPAVRARLAETGVHIPDSTLFVAGLHNTTTDEVLLYDVDAVPDTHARDLERISAQLAGAGASARSERAQALGLGVLQSRPDKLLQTLRARADDWAQTRPEWGLANNAAFIIARRSRTRGCNLEGRSFLHDYDHRQDADGGWLEQIMTAPMLVTNWINMQYFASTVDNRRFGSGNKTLHNVVDGRIGVFEGNGGDLRIGLPLQSVHDGERWMHQPLRLTVVIEAPREAIDRVIAGHEIVRQLIDNRWLHLMRLDEDQVEIYREEEWQPWAR